MMAMAVAVMSFAALLLAVNTLLLDRDDKLFGNSVELSDFLVAQATKNILGSLLVRFSAIFLPSSVSLTAYVRSPSASSMVM